jgi:hypothetical protein
LPATAAFVPTDRDLVLFTCIAQEKTGLACKRVGGIDTKDESIAAAVLPVLADWADKLDDVPHRNACYERFLTPFAHPFIDRIIDWWVHEQDKVASSILAQTLAIAFECSDAQRIWDLCHTIPRGGCYYLLLSKLAACPSVQREARDELVAALANQKLRVGDLSDIATVADPRIRKWFEGQTNSRDPNIKVLAKRVTARRALPRGVEYSERVPSREREMFSTECDLAEVKEIPAKLKKEFSVVLPPSLRSATFLAAAELNRWLIIRSPGEQPREAGLWLRMEDMDTVEILLTA